MAPVPIERSCPQCQATNVRFLTFNSEVSRVDYFRCPECGHVWNAPKHGETGSIRDVTIRRKNVTAPSPGRS